MKGILFESDMIKAIAEGRKTQTRRLGNLKSINEYPYEWIFKRFLGDGGDGKYWFQHPQCDRYNYLYNAYIKPLYQVEEVVYVKEAWMTEAQYDNLKPSEIPEVGRKVAIWYYKDGNHYADKVSEGAGKVRTPMFMPAWAARTFLRITDVRVERVREITERDAIAEGILSDPTIAVYEYSRLWDSINPKYPFASNPWVFRYEFEVKDGGI